MQGDLRGGNARIRLPLTQALAPTDVALGSTERIASSSADSDGTSSMRSMRSSSGPDPRAR